MPYFYNALQCRLIIVGKKKLPSVARHERYYAFVGESML
jgi:hypothetical protein